MDTAQGFLWYPGRTVASADPPAQRGGLSRRDRAALAAETTAYYRLHNSQTLHTCREHLAVPSRFEDSCTLLVRFLEKKSSWEWADVVLIVDCVKAVRAFGVRKGYSRAAAINVFDCLTKLLSTQLMDEILDHTSQVRIFEWSAQVRSWSTAQPGFTGIPAAGAASFSQPPPKEVAISTSESSPPHEKCTGSSQPPAISSEAQECLRAELMKSVSDEGDFLRLVRDVFGEDSKADGDVMCLTDVCRVSLNCPGSLARMNIPIRGKNCKHLQCFDLDTFVALNAQRPKWKCLHCDKRLEVADVVVDKHMMNILEQTDAEHVIVHSDGRWTPAADDARASKCSRALHRDRDGKGGGGNGDAGKDVIVIE